MNSILVLPNKNHFLFVLGNTCKCLIMFNVSPLRIPVTSYHGANVSRIFCKYEYERNTNRIAFFLVFFAIVFNSNVFSQPCMKRSLGIAIFDSEHLCSGCGKQVMDVFGHQAIV